MKSVYVALFLLSISSSFGADMVGGKSGVGIQDNSVPGVGMQVGDPCYCVTCIGHNKCAGNRANSDRTVVTKPTGGASRGKGRSSRVGEI